MKGAQRSHVEDFSVLFRCLIMKQRDYPYSTIEISDDMRLYERIPYTHEILVSLLVRWIVNISEIVRIKGKAYSLAQPLNMGHEKLWIEEILADICLIEVLTGNSGDRSIVPFSNDVRNQHGEHVTGNNCRVYHDGTYSVFDIDSLEFRKLWENDVLYEFYLALSRMYGVEDMPQKSSFLLYYELPSEKFWNRVANRVKLFLERYDCEDGEKLFLRQIAHASSDYRSVTPETLKKLEGKEDVWFTEDEELYKNFIYLLHSIYSIFSQNSYVLSEYIDRSRRVILKEIRETVIALMENLKLLVQKILWML